MKKTISYIIICSLIITFVSNACMKTKEEDWKAIEREALQSWIEVNAPNAKLLTDDIYYEVIESAPEGAASAASTYITYDMTLRRLDGRPGYTRNEETARLAGTFTRFTRYIPIFAELADSEEENSNIMKGVYKAITMMKVGDVWRLYLPSEYGVTSVFSSNSVGYGGEVSLNANQPVIVDNLKVVSISRDPEWDEFNYFSANAYLSLDENNFEYIGKRINDTTVIPDTHMLISRFRTTNKNIPSDSLVKLFYKTSVMKDGFIFETNIDTVQQRVFGRKFAYESYSYEYIHSAVDTTDTAYPILKALYTVMPHLHYGDSVRIAYTSLYGFGRAGQAASTRSNGSGYFPYTSEIHPYTSLVMDLVVMDKDFVDPLQ